ncbi:hypothetical protein HELRODRAFT_183515 [Helobdella robusta]|uniref:BHLH domain-containing protein n=1 Tax=Helobdella robusta TaxID=6412 RepID=T1FJS0_HELRO|nr:hypothetical protein HELRODRAFT_183515 [Helobdella robusta]ESO11128.1 hypothetical protein HELRODRAFT_183515 [Helobdella robusta]
MCKSFPDFVSLLLDAAATVDKNEEHCYAVRTTASTAQQTNVFNNNHNNSNNNNESSNKRYRNRSRNVKKQDSLRKKHNDMEKSRRANHKNLFLDLKLTLPPSLRSCRMSQIKTLNESHEQYLRLANEYEVERRKHFEYSSKLQMITRSHSRSSVESCADSGHYSCKSSSSSFSSSSPTALRDLDDNDVSSVDNDVTTNDDDVVAAIGDEVDDDSDSIIIDVM